MVRNARTNQDNTFEMIIKSLQPFMSSYDIASGQRVKLKVNETADAEQLEKVLNNSQGRAERGAGNVVYVSFGDLNNQDVHSIVSQAFGEPQIEVDQAQDEFGETVYEYDETRFTPPGG